MSIKHPGEYFHGRCGLPIFAPDSTSTDRWCLRAEGHSNQCSTDTFLHGYEPWRSVPQDLTAEIASANAAGCVVLGWDGDEMGVVLGVDEDGRPYAVLPGDHNPSLFCDPLRVIAWFPKWPAPPNCSR